MSAVNHTYAAAASGAGTGLFASRDFIAGELVMRLDADAISVLDTKKLDIACESCFLTAEEHADLDEIRLKKCGGCGTVKYCGQTCQQRSWKHHHKYECKIYKRLQPNVASNTVRMIMQILLRRMNNTFSDAEWEAIMKTQHHLDDFKALKQPQGEMTWEDIQLIAKGAKEYSRSNLDIGTVESIMCRTLVNCHTLVSPMMMILGLCFAPPASFLNHSCNPNTVITFSGPVFVLRALVPIPKSSQLFISYIHNTKPPPVRQAELKDRWFFTCACTECSASPPRTLGVIDPSAELLAVLPEEQLKALDARAEELKKDAKLSHKLGDWLISEVELLRRAMALFSPYPAYPAFRQPYAFIRFDLIGALMDKKQWISAFVHYLIMYFYIDPIQYPQIIHPVRVCHKYNVLRLAFLMASETADPEAGEYRSFRDKYNRFLDWPTVLWGLLKELKDSVQASHGTDSRFAVRVRKQWEMFNTDTSTGSRSAWEGPTIKELEQAWRVLRRIALDGLAGRIG